MSLHYILDGYNVIRQADFSSSVESGKDARLRLIRFIAEKKPCGSKNNRVTVVFDAGPDFRDSLVYSEAAKRYGIEIVFAKSDTADDRIKKFVNNSKNPKTIVVVSDDKDIRFFIRSLGAHPMSVAEFVKKADRRQRTAKVSPKAELSYQEAARINAELIKIWL